MSFVLEYRKKLLAQQEVQKAQGTPRPGTAVHDDPFRQGEDDAAQTPGNRRTVFLALVIAALVLMTFNSNALVYYARGLAEGPLGPTLLDVSERWHGIMESGRMTRLVESLRAVVADARETSWQDLSDQLGLSSVAARADGAAPARPGPDAFASAPSAPEGFR